MAIRSLPDAQIGGRHLSYFGSTVSRIPVAILTILAAIPKFDMLTELESSRPALQCLSMVLAIVVGILA